ncbi:hydroxyacylglutathione hydrolase [Gymnopilus junonius]|uniref:hydroxyacylglutathione hydrolase n=1 Tax=Gymnopilus junonius TaxID=109634 RepID=A0A9P5NW88_GYMJU|nr:hydroxyacylglutathione hydrolase [Gymnopilus junonius]
MKVVPVPVRQDNYAYLIIDERTLKAAAVDPYDVAKVSAAAEAHGVDIIAGITTHHHHDHSGGNQVLAKKYPTAPIYGGSDKIPALTKLVKDKDEFTVGDNISIKCFATPCHTQDSICYYVTEPSTKSHPGGVFTGDTLFIAGCGRFFEGVGSEMVTALEYLASLPDETIVYNGHEYTAGNLSFAKHVYPTNPALDKLAELVEKNSITTGLTTIGNEKEWNPFMCLDTDAIKKATGHETKSAVMDALREQKNKFKG